jgi:tRNA(Arg) A34 adenosine deaminase TadA
MFNDKDLTYMRRALEEADLARQRDEVPIGAVLVHRMTGELVSHQGNRTIERCDPTAHAEIMTIREVCIKVGAQRIPDFDLYVTLEPCTMCAAAIAFARIPRLIIGALDEKGGGILHGAKFFEQPTCHHKIEIFHGLLAEDSSQLLKNYFKSKRH